MDNLDADDAAPSILSSTVRTREYLTAAEIETLVAAARKFSRHGHRDATMILIGFRHGLRVSELCDLQWLSIAFETGPCTCGALKAAKRRPIQSSATNCGRCENSSASRPRPSSSPR